MPEAAPCRISIPGGDGGIGRDGSTPLSDFLNAIFLAPAQLPRFAVTRSKLEAMAQGMQGDPLVTFS